MGGQLDGGAGILTEGSEGGGGRDGDGEKAVVTRGDGGNTDMGGVGRRGRVG